MPGRVMRISKGVGSMLSLLATVIVVAAINSNVYAGDYTSIEVETESAYRTHAWQYAASGGNAGDIGIVFLHGKSGNPGTDHNKRFIGKLRAAGYNIIAPIMPWSKKRGYEGSREQGLEVIDESVRLLGMPRVVIIGHSMGGVAALQYGARGVAESVIGLVSIAPGHDPHYGGKLRRVTESDATDACADLRAGKGSEKARRTELNTGKKSTIKASAEYYCTYYSIEEYPDTQAVAEDISVPVLLVSGQEDRLTAVYRHADIMFSLPENDKNKHLILPGKHKSVLFKNTDAITEWLSNL